MSTYIKTMVITSVFLALVAIVGFKFSVNSTVKVLQISLDKQSHDASALIGQSLNGVDIETEIELVESLIRGAYALGSFQEVTLYGKPQKGSQNLRMQNKKDIAENAFHNSFFTLIAVESFSDILYEGEVQGKVLVKSDLTQAYKDMEKTVSELLQLFLILGFGCIVTLAIIIKYIVKEPEA